MFLKNKYWEKIQDFLPEHNHVSEDYKPQEKWINCNGIDIRYDEYNPSANSKISIVVLHGVGGNGRLLSFIAVPLVKAGFNVICPDLPGYGYTKIDSCFDYSTWIEVGTFMANEELKKGRRLFIFGLSAGGMLAYNVTCNISQVEGLIITNILDNRYQMVRDFSAKNKFHSRFGIKFLKILPDFMKKNEIPVKSVANTRTIVNQKELLKIMLKDKVGSGSSVSIKFLLSMMDMIPFTEPEDFEICPVLMAHPEIDQWTPVKVSRLFFDRIKSEKKLVILENAGHFPIESPGLQQLEKACIEFISNQ